MMNSTSVTAIAPPRDEPLDVVELALQLMAVDSTSGREAAVITLLESLLGAGGWTVRRIAVTPGRDALLATGVAEPLVTLSTHVDTVPPYIAPRVDGARLRGRGACDAKGIAAAMIVAAERLRAAEVPVALLFVIGEETCHDGAIAANRVPTTSRVLINGEPTASRLATGTKGAVRFVIRTEGRAAHSAYPELGVSATSALVRVLSSLEELRFPDDPDLGATTVNIGSLAGGVADNVIAPWAEARLMIRVVTSADDVAARLRAWVGARAMVSVGSAVPPVRLVPLAGYPTAVVAFATDLPELTNWGTPYLFGPGSIHVAHTDDEHIEIAELRAAVDVYERLAVDALAVDALAADALAVDARAVDARAEARR